MSEHELTRELRETFEKAAGHRPVEPEDRFHKGGEYITYRLNTPDFWRIMKQFKSRILVLPLQVRLGTAAELMAAHIGMLGHAAIHIWTLSISELEPDHYPYLDARLDDFRGWSHVDHFCVNVIQPLLERYPSETIDLLSRWNQAENRWRRRASVVAFTRNAAKSRLYADEVLRLCDNLKWDRDDLVRKGVGWALKDNLRSAPEIILPYVKRLRREGVSSTITLYAIKDLKGEARQAVLAVKKGDPPETNAGNSE